LAGLISEEKDIHVNSVSESTDRPVETTLLLDFVTEKVNSFIKWDLIRFFHDNPHARDTAENIARYTGRDVRTIQRELDGLVKAGVLDVAEVAVVNVYRLNDQAETRHLIDRFMDACHNRQFRVQAINRVIQAMQFSPRHDF
jgi:DNA-binding transcriptional ArsR family regulator